MTTAQRPAFSKGELIGAIAGLGVLSLVLLSCGGCFFSWWTSGPPEEPKFQGGWKVTTFEMEGQPQKDYESTHQEWLFSGESLTVKVKGQPHQGNWKLRSGKSPKEIDITPAPANKEDKPLYGIYAWDGDSLRVCLSEKKRPTEFRTKAGSDWVLVVLTRAEGQKGHNQPLASTPAPSGPQHQEGRSRIVGKWVEAAGQEWPGNRFQRPQGKTTAEFTNDGMAIIEWEGRLEEPRSYQMEGANRAICKPNSEYGDPYKVLLSSDTEIVLSSLYRSKRLVRVGIAQDQPKSGTPLEDVEKSNIGHDRRLIGKWDKVKPSRHPRGNYVYQSQSITITENGTLYYSGTRTLFTGSTGTEEATSRFTWTSRTVIRLADRKGDIQFDFVDDNEVIATYRGAHSEFEEVKGAFRRAAASK